MDEHLSILANLVKTDIKSPVQELKVYQQLSDALEATRKYQPQHSIFAVESRPTMANIAEFMAWIRNDKKQDAYSAIGERADSDGKHSSLPLSSVDPQILDQGIHAGLSIKPSPLGGFGVFTDQDIPKDQIITSIPRSLIFTSDPKESQELASLIEKDEMLTRVQSLALMLRLLIEAFDMKSEYKPYIDVLPREFNLPIYFSKEKMMLLKGTVSDVLFRMSFKLQSRISSISRDSIFIFTRLFRLSLLYSRIMVGC